MTFSSTVTQTTRAPGTTLSSPTGALVHPLFPAGDGETVLVLSLRLPRRSLFLS